MSLYDFRVALGVSYENPPFYALVMAAMLQADTDNLRALKLAWPNIWLELSERYNAPGGFLPEEIPVNTDQESR